MNQVQEEVMSFQVSGYYLTVIKIFGPVLSVGRFGSESEAIALANDTSYGLGAGIHSSEVCHCSPALWY